MLPGQAKRGTGVLSGVFPGELLQPLHPALVPLPPLLAPTPRRSEVRHTLQIISAFLFSGWIIICLSLQKLYEVTFTVSRNRINIWSYEIKYLLTLRARTKILYFISPCIICVTIRTSHSTETHQLELYKELWQNTAKDALLLLILHSAICKYPQQIACL